MEYNNDNEVHIKKYYNTFKHAVDSIMQSHLLLDEDMQVLNHYWQDYKVTSNYQEVWMWSSLSLFSGMFSILNKYKLTASIVASLTPSCVYLVLKLNEFRRNRNICSTINRLLRSLKLYNRLNSSIIEFFDKRYMELISLGFETKIISKLLINNKAKDFLLIHINNIVEWINCTTRCIKSIAEYSKIEDIDNYVQYLQFHLEDYVLCETSDFSLIMEKFQTLNEICILLTSNFLSCLGLSMCFRLWKIDYNVNNVLKLLPKVLCSTEKAYQETSNEFSHIRLLVTKVPQVKRQVPTISLERPLFDFLRQIQIIFDIGKHLEEIIVNENSKNMSPLLEYLEAICTQYSKANTSLIAMQKILARYKKETDCPNQSITEENIKAESLSTANTVRYDDPVREIEDEEFTLSLHGSDDELEESNVDEHYEYLLEQLATQKLLMQELNDKLAIVRKKKGIDDKPKKEREKMKEAGMEKKFAIVELVSTTSLTPPPPPPLPTDLQISKLDAVNRRVADESNVTYIARAVEMCANQLNRKEEVFTFDGEDLSEEENQ